MAALLTDADLRERIRANVGHAYDPFLIHRAQAIGPRTRLGGPATGAPPSPKLPGAPVAGLTFLVSLTVVTGTRRVGITQPIGFKHQVRRIVLMGSAAITAAISYRLFTSDDPDTTAVAAPTGDELIEATGDLVGAEDAGIHAALSLGPLVVEPYILVPYVNRVFKLKVHNVTGATHTVTAAFDVDELAE